jgi:hypothetical protein
VKQKNLVLIPFWIEKVLKRNNLPVSESLNYSKLSGLLSLSDLSAFLFFQNCDSFNIFVNENSALLSSWEQTCQDELRVELDSTVVPLSFKEEATRYVEESFAVNSEASDTYRVVDLDRENYGIVIYPGFPEYVNENRNRVKVIEDLLKVLYKYFELHEVSNTDIFKSYLKQLHSLSVAA